MKNLPLILLVSVTAAFPAFLTAKPVLKIEITPTGWFSKPQTLQIPVSLDGSLSEARSGTEQTFFSVQSETINGNTTETVFRSKNEFFGVIASASSKDGITSVKLTFRKLLGTASSPDGLSTAPITSEQTIQSSFSGNYYLEAEPSRFGKFKRICFTAKEIDCEYILLNTDPSSVNQNDQSDTKTPQDSRPWFRRI
jgi:hypothetical protein